MAGRFPDAVRAVVGSSLAGGVAFGGALGIYRGVVCSLEHMRGCYQLPLVEGQLLDSMLHVFQKIKKKLQSTVTGTSKGSNLSSLYSSVLCITVEQGCRILRTQ